MNNLFENIEKSILKAKTILITSHKDSDGDSLGSMLAIYNYVKSIDKNATILNHGDIPEKYKFYPGIENITGVDQYQGSTEFDLKIILECPTPERSGNVIKYIENNDNPILNIDHHPDNTGYGDIAWVNEKASSVGEMLTEFFLGIGFNITEDTATLLFASILTDTGRFRFNSTSSRTMEIAGKLIDCGADPRHINDKIYYSAPTRILKLQGLLLSGMKLYQDGKICLISLEKNMLNENNYNPSDTEGMSEYSLYDNNVVVGGFLREISNEMTRVSLRSREHYNVSQLAHKYGGGGHVNASGFTIRLPIKAAREKLLAELQEMINATV